MSFFVLMPRQYLLRFRQPHFFKMLKLFFMHKILLLLLMPFLLPAQSFDISYSAKYKSPATSGIKPNNMPPAVYKRMLQNVSKIRQIYSLKYVNGTSKFTFEKSTDAKGKTLQSIHVGHPFYKNFGAKKLIIKSSLKSDQGVDESLEELNSWTLINRDSVINEFTCKMAINNIDNAQAWYSTEIAIPDGPKHYGLLPGLIISLSDEKSIYEINSLTSSTEENKSIKPPVIVNKISYQKYIESHLATPGKR